MDDEARAYLERMQKERGYALEFHRVLAEHDFPLLQAYNALVEAAYLRPRRIDRKTKELLYVAVLTALGSSAEHIRAHMRAAVDAGAGQEELLEVLEMVLAPAGVPRFMHGVEVWRALFDRAETRDASTG